MTTIKETLMEMSEDEQSTGDGSLIRRINCPVPMIPRPYARGDSPRAQCSGVWSCFNPRPYARATDLVASHELGHEVSIHAPTRGRLVVVLWVDSSTVVSIHAPTRGATQRGDTTTVIMTFQSTPLRERRLYRLYYTHIQSFLFCISRIKSLLLIKSRTKKYNRYNRLIINRSEPYEIHAMH